MKREYVIPDLLASLTADALFAGAPRGNSEAMPAATGPSTLQRLSQWFKRAPATDSSLAGVSPRHTLSDDWVGGWYARTRLLQSATLAQHAADGSAADPETSTATTPAARGAGARRTS